MSDYFGEPWPSGVCDDGHRVPTPTGQECFSCGEPIEAHHQGSFLYDFMADRTAAPIIYTAMYGADWTRVT